MMNQIDIHRATIEDLEPLTMLFDGYRVFYKQPSDHVRARTFLTERLGNDDSVIYIARINESYVGFTQLYPTFSSVSTATVIILNDLYVYPEHRKKNIATALINKAVQYAKDISAKGLVLETDNDNPAQKLYEKLGWKKDENLHYYIDLHSEITM